MACSIASSGTNDHVVDQRLDDRRRDPAGAGDAMPSATVGRRQPRSRVRPPAPGWGVALGLDTDDLDSGSWARWRRRPSATSPPHTHGDQEHLEPRMGRQHLGGDGALAGDDVGSIRPGICVAPSAAAMAAPVSATASSVSPSSTARGPRALPRCDRTAFVNDVPTGITTVTGTPSRRAWWATAWQVYISQSR